MSRTVIRFAGIMVLAVVLTILSSSLVLAADSEFDDSSGALIVAVIAGSPASDANLVRGDVILAMGDEPVAGNADLRALIRQAAPGDVIPFTIRHGDDEFVVDVELGDSDGRPFLGVYLARDIEPRTIEDSVDDEAMEEPEAEEPDAEEAVEAEAVEESDEDVAEDAGAEAAAIETPSEDDSPEGAASDDAEVDDADADDADADDADVDDADADDADADDADADDADEQDADETVESDEAAAPKYDKGPHVFGMLPFTDTAAGAIIFAVVDDSPADEAGINIGDVILGVDGERLRHVEELADIVDDREPGDEITLEVLRRTGELEEVTAVLGEHPEDEDRAFLGIGFLPTPRRMFLGNSRDGHLLVPPMPFFHHGPEFGGQDPHHRWLPKGHPFGNDCEDGMPWWSCDEDEDEDEADAGDMDGDDSSEENGDENALVPMTVAA